MRERGLKYILFGTNKRPKQVAPEKEAPAAPTAGAAHPDRANSHIDDDPIAADKFAEDWDEIKK